EEGLDVVLELLDDVGEPVECLARTSQLLLVVGDAGDRMRAVIRQLGPIKPLARTVAAFRHHEVLHVLAPRLGGTREPVCLERDVLAVGPGVRWSGVLRAVGPTVGTGHRRNAGRDGWRRYAFGFAARRRDECLGESTAPYLPGL